MDIDSLFYKSYLNEFSEKEKKKILRSHEDRKITELKKQTLMPIAQFLDKFIEVEAVVYPYNYYSKNLKMEYITDPKPFKYCWIDSSKKWSPGVSLWIEHPAQIEIAIPNNVNVYGEIFVHVASEHPDSYILEHKFSNVSQVCEALGIFLGKCTVAIHKHPSSFLKDKKITEDSTNYLLVQKARSFFY